MTVVRIVLPERAFDQTVKALVAKFGEPSDDSKSVVQNRMGASFDNRRLVWSSATALLEVQQRYKTVEESMVLLADPTAIQDMDKREEEVARSARATAKKL